MQPLVVNVVAWKCDSDISGLNVLFLTTNVVDNWERGLVPRMLAGQPS